MRKKILWYLLMIMSVFSISVLWTLVNAQSSPKTDPQSTPSSTTNTTTNATTTSECHWIKLNTDFPFIWNCISIKKWSTADESNPTNVFPRMMSALTKIIITIILVVCFILIIVAGIKWSSWDPKWWKDLIKKVAITIILLWLAWVILKLVNPAFFS